MKRAQRKKPAELLIPLPSTATPETRKRLERIAANEGRTLSQVVRSAVEEFLQRRRGAA